MTIRSYNFEGGAATTAVAAGQSGSGDPFDTVTVTNASTVTYDTTHAMHGTKAALVTPTSTGQARFDYRFTSSAIAARAYIYLTALPAVDTILFQILTPAFARAVSWHVNGAGKLRLSDSSGTTGVFTAAATIPLNQWVRLELFATPGADTTTGTLKGAMYLGDSTTPIEAAYSSTTANTGTVAFGGASAGRLNLSSYLTPFWVDDFAANDSATGFVGPFTAPAASSVRPSGVTANPGAWTNQGGAATLDAALADESDVTFLQTVDNPAAASITLAMPPLATGDVTVKVRHQASAASPAVSRLYELLQGSTVIATNTVTLPTAWTDYAFTTTPAQTAAITDRTALALRVTDTSA